MRLSVKNILRHFRRCEDGTASLEFVLVAPVFISLLIMSIELGFVTVRNTMLERGMDIAVREIRLGTGSAPQHDAIKQIICDNTVVINDCMGNLRLEMRSTDIRAFNALDPEADCNDNAEPAKPLRKFEAGDENELMLLRACLKYNPLFPEEVLGSALRKDDSGQVEMIAMTAFVQEPK
ncbi:TadE-like protein [Roseovarius lutimaris]|uniref:TadE-like protein n=1 Tax=Roseovarius lutimaris TaxID=1005928 RepID=A0A1I4Z9D8_9RHOB|nr:TadE/TadG family type IV pilus assembly protein [Roseovarius lutimaris]SFN46912.1 TadE-like protein [Roseovarius lutimaris]